MTADVMKEQRPISKMAPKTHSEVFTYSPETDELPEGAYRPKKNLCFIAPIKAEEKTKGGIIIPGMAKEAEEYLQSYGRIVAVGPFFYKTGLFKEDPDPLEVGDYVHFEPYAAKRQEIDGKLFYLVKDADIYSIIDPFTHNYKVYA